MDTFEKLTFLGDVMRFEPAEEHRPPPPESQGVPQGVPWSCPAEVQPERGLLREGSGEYSTGARLRRLEPSPAGQGMGKKTLPIYQAVMPNGQRMPLLKTLLTSACERDCYYCVFRSGNDHRRTTFRPEELAKAFMQLYRSGTARGLFLSSGVAGGGVRTQDCLIATAEILRKKLGFRGYLHLKLMPGADRDQVERAMHLADRVSINLEGPNPGRLEQLAPHKGFHDELWKPLVWVDEIRKSQPAYKGWNGRWPSTVTQFVVGGVGESDLELLTTTAHLHQQVGLRRAYFSKFSPVPNTPLENIPPENPWREHRLYQASFLIRDYGFDMEELPFLPSGNLPLHSDPKLAWAAANLAEKPVEINQADPHELLRVPGIGPRGVQAILSARRQGRLHSPAAIKACGIRLGRAAPYILLDGKRPPLQEKLF
jgi:predicted DNA-binding helix-hairpin-helix protein